MGANLKVDGMDILREDFREMEKAVDNTLLDAALDMGSKIMATAIQKRAPRALKHRGPSESKRGRTIGGRKIVRSSKWRNALHMADTIKASKKRGRDKNRYCYVGPDEGQHVEDNKTAHFYWYFQEFGRSNMTAKPFMAPGYDEAEASTQKAIEETLIKGLGL